jgi:hypothetical protein
MFILERGSDNGSDATLSDLKVSGTTIAGFASARPHILLNLQLAQLQFHKLQRL